MAMDGDSVFYATPDGVQQVAHGGTSPVGAPETPVTVARAGRFAYEVTAVALHNEDLYWADGRSLRHVDKSNVAPTGDGTPSADVTDDTGGYDFGPIPGSGCPSAYDGTYFGIFAYEYEAGDPDVPESLHTVVSSLSLTIRLECVAVALGTAALTIVHATADDPWFGCTVGGCQPQMGSSVALPAEVPTTVANVSQSGHGIIVLFPNGTMLTTNNGPGSVTVTVTTDARKLSSSLDPGIADQTWGAAVKRPEQAYP